MCQLKSLLLDTTPVVQTAVASPPPARGAGKTRGRDAGMRGKKRRRGKTRGARGQEKAQGGEEARAAHARRKSRGRKKKTPCRGAQAGRKDGGRTRAQKKTPCPPPRMAPQAGGRALPPKKPLQTKAPSLCLSNASHSPSSFISSVNLQTAGTLPLPEETFSTRPA